MAGREPIRITRPVRRHNHCTQLARAIHDAHRDWRPTVFTSCRVRLRRTFLVVKCADFGLCCIRDPFIWRDHRGNFHCIFHKFTDGHPRVEGMHFRGTALTGRSRTIGHNTTVFLSDGTVNFNRRALTCYLKKQYDGRAVQPPSLRVP